MSITTELFAKIDEIKKGKQRDEAKRYSYGEIVEELLRPEIESHPLFRTYMPRLEFVSAHGDLITLRDNIKKKSIDIYVRNSELWCSEDESKECVHIGFAWAIPMVYKVMKEHGAKPPK